MSMKWRTNLRQLQPRAIGPLLLDAQWGYTEILASSFHEGLLNAAASLDL
jgi:hypothetical protein